MFGYRKTNILGAIFDLRPKINFVTPLRYDSLSFILKCMIQYALYQRYSSHLGKEPFFYRYLSYGKDMREKKRENN